MNKKTITIIVLSLAIILGFATRFYKLGEVPAGLYLDEAGQGYSAYSILKTGKDEFGKSFPIVFRAFTDFKTPVYIYLLVPLIPIFGLTSFAIRFPSFVFSILTLPILFMLVKELAPKKVSLSLSLLSTLLLSISPWHIIYGRTIYETNVALFFFLSGVLLFYKALKKPPLLLVSAVLFAIAIPAYHAQRVVTPLILFLLFLRHKDKLLSKSHKNYLIYGLIIGFLISLPTLAVATTPGFLARASGLNIFSHLRQLPAGYIESYTGPLSFLINGSWFLTVKEFTALYTSYFSPRNMFILGDYGPRSSFPQLSTFLLWQFPFYIYGFYAFLKNKKLGELKFFTLSLLLISPLPAAVTRDPYSSIRALPMVIPLTILISYGLIKTYRLLVIKAQYKYKSLLKVTSFSIFFLAIIYSIARIYSSVFVLNEYYRANSWNYGWEQVVNTLETLDSSLPVVVDNSRNEPYIHLLFFLKYPPEKYQKENYEVPLNQYYTNMQRVTNKKIGNITTRPIEWKKDTEEEKYLIGDRLAISEQQIQEHRLELIKEVKYPDGIVAFRIVKSKPQK